ncbi:RNA polymerase sigma factor [Streptomyces sp. CB03234]|uniref:RNA polymerase sigma factor n=1 Tax=Streptomyces sp. (strain CB03234) TaxID=1703937 RepID=UPI00093CD797|nr:sigma-70 family RNA polymerase sigma factor [Streptomyces sp. CB03234]
MATDMHAPSDDDRWQRAWSHREQLLKVARRRSMSQEDAEDAVHEAMLRAAEQPHLDDERLGAWLTTVTMRLCVDRHRQVRREADPGRAAALVPPGPAPVDEVVCDRAEATWLARRSGELPARQAEALWLKSEDLDVGQVARKMGLSYRTVESLLARARRTLRNSLAATLGLVLWLCGRGRPRGVGNAHVVAAASTAATLAVAGFVAPYAHDWSQDRPASAPATSGAADVRPGDGAHPPVSSAPVTSERPAPASAPGSGAPSTGPSPLLTEPALPVLPLPLPPLPDAEVPEVPEVPPVPEVPALPAVSDVPEVAGVPEVPDVPKVPKVPDIADVPEVADVPEAPDVPETPDTPEVPTP